VTGPFFTPDDCTVFVAIQHPGVDNYTWTNPASSPSFTEGNFAAPGTTWNTTPAISGKTPGVPRPAALAIRRLNGLPVAYGVEPPVEVPEFPLPVLAAGSAAVIGGLIAFRHRRMSAGTDAG
jgi:hypothetical protein